MMEAGCTYPGTTLGFNDQTEAQQVMSISTAWERNNGVLVGILSGRVDSANAPALQDAIDANFDATDKSLVLDFANVAYMSSAGLRVVIGTAKRLKEANKDFRVCSFTKNVSQIFEISGLGQVISVYPSRAAALGELALEAPGQDETGDADQVLAGLLDNWNPTIDHKALAQLIDQDLLGENLRELALFTVDKHELINNLTLSEEAKADAVSQVHAALNRKMATLMGDAGEILTALRLRLLKTLLSEADAVLNDS